MLVDGRLDDIVETLQPLGRKSQRLYLIRTGKAGDRRDGKNGARRQNVDIS